MIRVLMFGWEFPPYNSGGLGTACFGLTKALSAKDVYITFVLPRKFDIPSSSKFKVRFAQPQGGKINIKLINSIIEPYLTSSEYGQKLLKLQGRKNFGNSLLDEVDRYTALSKNIVADSNFDVIHAHDWMSFQAGIEAKRLTGKPLIVHVHSTEVDRTGGNNNDQIYWIEKEGMDAADLVITVSEYTKKMVIQYYGIPASKIEVVHNGIDFVDSEPAQVESSEVHKFKQSGYKAVLFVGRLTIQKGPDYFLNAAKLVLQYYPKVIFIITGAGDLEHKTISQAASLGISDKVFFTGFLRGDELKKIYQMADLFVMPSVSEPFGLTALESVTNGTPVLVSKQSGVKEVLTHVLTADFWDVQELANKILAVLNYSSLQLTLKQNSKEQVKGINWDQSATRCIGIYKALLDQYFQKS